MIARRLPGGRLHVQHGPIDLVIGADGGRERAFEAARARMEGLLAALCDELPLLRAPLAPGSPVPMGPVARRMEAAARPHEARGVTPMIAVAGAVADEVLAAMATPDLRRAYVNNGGDIALFAAPGERLRAAIAGHDGADLGRVGIGAGTFGIATSGRHGRSLSLGIADSVTVVAPCAAEADAAATLVANAVDLPGHPGIRRRPASEIDPESDLGERLATVGLGPLSAREIGEALARGLAEARALGVPAALTLSGRTAASGAPFAALEAA